MTSSGVKFALIIYPATPKIFPRSTSFCSFLFDKIILIEFGDNFSAFIFSNISKPSISGIITSISITSGESPSLIFSKIKDGLSPLVMLIDVIMPEMDGFEMLEKINAEKLSPNSIKIILSNKNEQKDVERGNILGVAGYIIKANLTPLEVINQVIDILSKKTTIPKSI